MHLLTNRLTRQPAMQPPAMASIPLTAPPPFSSASRFFPLP